MTQAVLSSEPRLIASAALLLAALENFAVKICALCALFCCGYRCSVQQGECVRIGAPPALWSSSMSCVLRFLQQKAHSHGGTVCCCAALHSPSAPSPVPPVNSSDRCIVPHVLFSSNFRKNDIVLSAETFCIRSGQLRVRTNGEKNNLKKLNHRTDFRVFGEYEDGAQTNAANA